MHTPIFPTYCGTGCCITEEKTNCDYYLSELRHPDI